MRVLVSPEPVLSDTLIKRIAPYAPSTPVKIMASSSPPIPSNEVT